MNDSISFMALPVGIVEYSDNEEIGVSCPARGHSPIPLMLDRYY